MAESLHRAPGDPASHVVWLVWASAFLSLQELSLSFPIWSSCWLACILWDSAASGRATPNQQPGNLLEIKTFSERSTRYQKEIRRHLGSQRPVRDRILQHDPKVSLATRHDETTSRCNTHTHLFINHGRQQTKPNTIQNLVHADGINRLPVEQKTTDKEIGKMTTVGKNTQNKHHRPKKTESRISLSCHANPSRHSLPACITASQPPPSCVPRSAS